MKIKKGDKVKIKDGGETYTTFERMFIELGFKNTEINLFEESYIDLTWTVVDVVKHPYEHKKIAFIKSDEKELLISIKGLELIESQPTYKLTKYQIIAIAENGSLVKELFPECFENANGWYKEAQSYGNWYGFYENDILKYVITDEGFSYIHGNFKYNGEKNATPEEVTEALINEAKRRGFEGHERLVWKIDDCKFSISKPELSSFNYEKNNNILTFACGTVFDNGKWAEIIKTPTEVIKVIETYGKDKLITLIEAYNGKN